MATSSEEYEAIYQFLRYEQYPEGFSKNDKRVLRRKSKENYQVVKDVLFTAQEVVGMEKSASFPEGEGQNY